MAAPVQRIVVNTTARDKEAIAAKAKKLDIPVSELLRRGAFAYQPSATHEELAALAEAAKGAADRAGAAIDETLAFVDESNKRIARMEAKAARSRKAGDRKAA